MVWSMVTYLVFLWSPMLTICVLYIVTLSTKFLIWVLVSGILYIVLSAYVYVLGTTDFGTTVL